MKASMKAKPGRRRQLSATFAGHICVELQGNLGIRIVGCRHNLQNLMSCALMGESLPHMKL